jgi:hypothetical protein
MATNAWNNYYGSLPQYLIDLGALTIGTTGGTASYGALDIDLSHKPYSGFVCTDLYLQIPAVVGHITTSQTVAGGLGTAGITLTVPAEGLRWTFNGGSIRSYTAGELAAGCFCPNPCSIEGTTFEMQQLGAGAAKRVRQVNQAGQSETLIGGGSFNNTTWPGQGTI